MKLSEIRQHVAAEIGDMAISRATLAEALPDIERFERCLPNALRVDEHMTDNGGAVPTYCG